MVNSNIYITGDTHADFNKIFKFCNKYKANKNDLMIVLGDAGINYYLNDYDYILKEELLNYPITLFCIHGNHEEIPENIKTYKSKTFNGGIVYYEEKYPNILFAKDGEIYTLNGKKVLVIGGAYSIDKDYRLMMGYNWYKSEQITDECKNEIRNKINQDNKIDIVLSHTCPFKYMPYEAFLSGVDQSKVDTTTEKFLNEIESKLNYEKWYCGHYHIDKKIDKIRFMMDDIDIFN